MTQSKTYSELDKLECEQFTLRKKIGICRKDFKRAQNAAHRTRPERSCWGKVTLRQSAPTWHRHRQISCTSTVNRAHSAAETAVFQDGKTQAGDSKEIGDGLDGRESCWCCSESFSSKGLGAVCIGGAATGSQKAESGHKLEAIAPNPLPMETHLSKIGLCCEEGCYYSKEPELTCQFVTECIYMVTYMGK